MATTSKITTKHAGCEIVYIEADDTWRAPKLNIQATTLSSIKEQITKHLDKVWKVDNVRAWHLGWRDPELCIITRLDWDDHAWVHPVGAPEERKRVPRRELVLDTPENVAAIKRCRELERAARSTEITAAIEMRSIPRFDPRAGLA